MQSRYSAFRWNIDVDASTVCGEKESEKGSVLTRYHSCKLISKSFKKCFWGRTKTQETLGKEGVSAPLGIFAQALDFEFVRNWFVRGVMLCSDYWPSQAKSVLQFDWLSFWWIVEALEIEFVLKSEWQLWTPSVYQPRMLCPGRAKEFLWPASSRWKKMTLWLTELYT